MALFRRAVCGARWLGILASAWVFFGESAAAEPARGESIRGRELFFREWMPGDARSHGGDGLGPLYNETSCVACHNLGAPGGAGPASKNVEIMTLRGRTPKTAEGEFDEYHPGFRNASSVLLHRFGTEPEYKAWRLRRTEGVEFADLAGQGGEAELEQVRETLGLKPNPRARALAASRGPARGATPVKGPVALSFGAVVMLTRRNPPPLFGAGLIDAIPIGAIQAAAARPDRDFPEARGRLHYLNTGASAVLDGRRGHPRSRISSNPRAPWSLASRFPPSTRQSHRSTSRRKKTAWT
jgi:hypothetical protein